MTKPIDEAKLYLDQLRVSYQQALGPTPATDAVLKDLAKFCHAFESSFHSDQRIHAVIEGRREVFLRIMDFLKLSPDELYRYYIRRN